MEISKKSLAIATVIVVLAVASLVYPLIKSNQDIEEERSRLSKQLTIAEKEILTYKEILSEKEKVIRTVTVKPDGTHIVQEEIYKEKTKVIDKNAVKEKVSSETQVAETSKKKVSAHVERYSVTIYRDFGVAGSEHYGADIAARLGNLPIEAVGLTVNGGKDFYIGVRYRW